MESGYVVEFIDNQKIICAVVLDVRNLRLRLLTEHNREVKMSVGRLSHRCDARLDITAGRDKLLSRLKEISARRRNLSTKIDLQSLWEVLNSEQEWIDLATMTALCFPDDTGGDHESAVIRAVFNNRLYFKFNPERFFPHSEEKVGQIIAQQKAAEQKARIIEQGGQWMRQSLKGNKPEAPPEKAEIINILNILRSYFLHDKESPHKETAREILKRAGAGTPTAIFSFMVNIGEWQEHENLELLKHDITAELPEEVLIRARGLCETPLPSDPDRRDLRDLAAMTIDGPGTLDFDDALSISPVNGGYLLGIHIADVAHYVLRDSVIDEEARSRTSSIYMPDQKIPMLPTCLSEETCSLRADRDRLAVSTLITITENAEILDFEIVPSLIRVSRQLSYQDADAMVDEDPAMVALHNIAKSYRRRRLDNGALMIELPEIAIWLNPGGETIVTRIDRESPSRMMVSELMIMSNELTARYLADHQVPSIFRCQAEPRERLIERDDGTLFQNWMQRRQINRFILNSTPEPHAGLGVQAYVTASSPIRKYTDLVTQRQIRSVRGLEPAYGKEEIDYLIASIQETMARVGRIQYLRHRYWLLKYLERLVGQKTEGLVLNKRREGYAILLPDYMIECHLSGAENIKLKPEDLVQVTLQHVNARNDIITVYLG